MKLLLDTHTFLWFISADTQLDSYARELIENLHNERYLSVASLWEITIKSGLGRLDSSPASSTLVRDHVWANAIDLLAIRPEHLDALHQLPNHHKDPFDRLLIAQALREDLVIVTRDQALSAYDAQVVWKLS